MCPWTLVGRSRLESKSGWLWEWGGGDDSLPAYGHSEKPSFRRPCGGQGPPKRRGWSRGSLPGSALQVSRVPGTLETEARGRPLPAGRLEPRAAPARTPTHPLPPALPKPAAPRCSSPHPTSPGRSEAWHTDSLHNPSLFVGGGVEPGAAALSQPTDPIKYYLCLKIPVIGYAAAFSEPRAKRSKNSQSGRSYFHHANSHFL